MKVHLVLFFIYLKNTTCDHFNYLERRCLLEAILPISFPQEDFIMKNFIIALFLALIFSSANAASTTNIDLITGTWLSSDRSVAPGEAKKITVFLQPPAQADGKPTPMAVVEQVCPTLLCPQLFVRLSTLADVGDFLVGGDGSEPAAVGFKASYKIDPEHPTKVVDQKNTKLPTLTILATLTKQGNLSVVYSTAFVDAKVVTAKNARFNTVGMPTIFTKVGGGSTGGTGQ